MSNRLANEPGLYLRQHSENPVDWYPWGPEALSAARAQGKPILLSIGYSACHWCHVMARECFEHAKIAQLMNANFLNIKVDREERPDLDRIYQLAHQAITRRGGGWPLTVFLRPNDLLPFFAGTYFPPAPRHGLPSFPDVLLAVRRYFDEQPASVEQQCAALQGFLADYGRGDPRTEPLSDQPIRRALTILSEHADLEHGGHRGAPKFPHAVEIDLQLRFGDRYHADRSLLGMARGGLQDHLGGGFFRYCVDASWGIPHFEKMLYDNALLLPLYAEAAATSDDDAQRRIFSAAAEGIVSWLRREMALVPAGFAAALDADSEHEEGRYYLWQRDEVRQLLPVQQADLIALAYGLDAAPNFEGKCWHLRQQGDEAQWLEVSGLTLPGLRQKLNAARGALLTARQGRVAPARDDKCLTSWNGLLLSGLARAGIASNRSDWIGFALDLANALHTQHWHQGRLCAVVNGRQRRVDGLLDDYAAVFVGVLDTLGAEWRVELLDFAVELADAVLSRFEDRDGGGFFLTPDDHESLPQRPKPFTDDATPSGNGLIAQGLRRLGALLAEPRYLESAERTVRAAWSSLEELPHASCSLLLALQDCITPAPLLLARFASDDETRRWASTLQQARQRGAQVLRIAANASMLPPALADKRWMAGGRVYWCEGLRCRPRFDSPVALEAALRERDEAR